MPTASIFAFILVFLCSTIYLRRVPRINKALVGEGAPFRLVSILSGQFDYLLSIACTLTGIYILLA
jgi:hypothetical protein